MPQLWNDNAPLGNKVPELPYLIFEFVAIRRRGGPGSPGTVSTARAVVVTTVMAWANFFDENRELNIWL